MNEYYIVYAASGQYKDYQKYGQETFVWPGGRTYTGGWKCGSQYKCGESRILMDLIGSENGKMGKNTIGVETLAYKLYFVNYIIG